MENVYYIVILAVLIALLVFVYVVALRDLRTFRRWLGMEREENAKLRGDLALYKKTVRLMRRESEPPKNNKLLYEDGLVVGMEYPCGCIHASLDAPLMCPKCNKEAT